MKRPGTDLILLISFAIVTKMPVVVNEGEKVVLFDLSSKVIATPMNYFNNVSYHYPPIGSIYRKGDGF